ncbi:ribonuclease HIII [Mycoplasmatota bacterium WC30]
MNYDFSLNDANIEKFVSYYQQFKENNTDPRILHSFKGPDFKIIIYNSKKVLFQGKSGYEEYLKWGTFLGYDIKKPIDESTYINEYFNKNVIGSDEVGTGDFFGPVVVCAAYVTKSDNDFMEELNIRDSKGLSDAQIITLAPKLIEHFTHHVLVLNPEKFNSLTSEGYNLNKIKAYLHNHAIKKMVQNCPNYNYVILDQFCSPKNYFEYLKTETVFDKIQFHTKGESVHKAVAIASIIARYKFLLEMDKLSENISITLPKGSGAPTDAIGKVIYLKYGEEIFSKIAKINFKNFNKITNKTSK